MAADVKIGLLLSLVLVFVLAFALNRVPLSSDRKGDGDLTPVMVSGPPGIRPALPPESGGAWAGGPAAPAPQRPASQTPAPQTTERFRTPLAEAAPSERASQAVEPAKPAPPTVRYIVCEGDSLAYIARKFYGPVQGNKRENVMKIFEANRGVLKAPDQIDIGQELVIPPLEASQPPRPATQGGAAAQAKKTTEPTIFSDPMFEKVDSIGRKPL